MASYRTGSGCLGALLRVPRPAAFTSVQPQHPSQSTRNFMQIIVTQMTYMPPKSAFVDVAYMLDPHLGARARSGDCHYQRKTLGFCRTGQRDDDHCFSHTVDFVGGQNNAWACFGHFRTHDRVKCDPMHLPAENGGVQLRAFLTVALAADSLARSAACAISNSRSKVSRSKSGSQSSTDPVKSASTHSCPLRANSGSAASNAFMASHAAISCWSSKFSSRRTRSTKKALRLRGGTVRASLTAKSSGSLSKTCLGGLV